MQNEEILSVLERQLQNFWDIRIVNPGSMLENISKAITKVNQSFDASNNKYYLQSGFSILNMCKKGR